jgi:hypothetical protein
LAIWDTVVEWVKRRLGILKVFRIYVYVVRLSGYTIPPADVRKKARREYNPKTPIQWELSFEEGTFFRTLTENLRDAAKRYEDDLRELVREQERRAIEEFSFRPTIAVDIEEFKIPQKTVEAFLKYGRYASKRKETAEDLVKRGQIEVSGRPDFVIQAVDFEPVRFIDISEDKLREFRATDNFIFKLFRPEDESPYQQWRGDFSHEL